LPHPAQSHHAKRTGAMRAMQRRNAFTASTTCFHAPISRMPNLSMFAANAGETQKEDDPSLDLSSLDLSALTCFVKP
jgi:hypothetical protein